MVTGEKNIKLIDNGPLESLTYWRAFYVHSSKETIDTAQCTLLHLFLDDFNRGVNHDEEVNHYKINRFLS